MCQEGFGGLIEMAKQKRMSLVYKICLKVRGKLFAEVYHRVYGSRPSDDTTTRVLRTVLSLSHLGLHHEGGLRELSSASEVVFVLVYEQT